MKAVICAAGVGKRLYPHTKNIPKALLPAGGKLVIEHILDALSVCGIREALLVAGHGAEALQNRIGEARGDCRITYVHNPEYETTNNIYSLWLARDHIGDGMIFLNADTIFSPAILEAVLESSHPDAFAFSASSRVPEDAIAVRLDKRGRLVEIEKRIENPHGQSKSIYKLSQPAAERYFSIAGDMFAADPANKNVSFVRPLRVMAPRIPIASVEVGDLPWAEIDTLQDYADLLARPPGFFS